MPPSFAIFALAAILAIVFSTCEAVPVSGTSEKFSLWCGKVQEISSDQFSALVMLPLDTIGHDLNINNPAQLSSHLSTLKALGVDGYDVVFGGSLAFFRILSISGPQSVFFDS